MSRTSVRQPRATYTATLIALALVPITVAAHGALSSHVTTIRQVRLPVGQTIWRGPLPPTSLQWLPQFVGDHTQVLANYEGPRRRTVQALAIGYREQIRGQELVNEENSLTEGIAPVATGTAVQETHVFREEVVRDNNGKRFVIWSFYDIGGRTFTAPVFSQLWYGVHFLGNPPYSAFFAFRTDCQESCADARAALSSFVREVNWDALVAKNSTCYGRPSSGFRDRLGA